MPPDVPLHFVDTTLDITAMDDDFVCTEPDCNTDDTSNNIVASCIVEGDTEDVIKCEPKQEGDSGLYRMFVSLKKSIDNLAGSSYTFKLKAQVSKQMQKLDNQLSPPGWRNPSTGIRPSYSHSQFS